MADQSAVERLADQWNATPDNSSTDYDCGRVDQRHDMTTQLLEAIEADRARAGVVAEPEWEYGVKPYPDQDDVYSIGETAARVAVRRGSDEGYELLRRSKTISAGPWVPVKQEGAETDG